jgi:hypothetical protein
LWLFLNQGTDAGPELAAGARIALPEVGVARSHARPFVADWDEDGRKDLLLGDANGSIYLFVNAGTDAAPVFTTAEVPTGQGGPIAVSGNATPFVVDWNNDGVRDLIDGSKDGGIYLATGTPASTPVDWTEGEAAQDLAASCPGGS